jgi:hypothetical protein
MDANFGIRHIAHKIKAGSNLKITGETRIYQKHSRKKIHPQGKIDFLPYSFLKLFNELF